MMLHSTRNISPLRHRSINRLRSYFYGPIRSSHASDKVWFGDVEVTRPPQSTMHQLVPTRCATGVPDCSETNRHLLWIAQKFVLQQDIFLIGSPGSLKRKLAFLFCELLGAETELLVLSRDTVEADLRQRKEIGGDGTRTVYIDGAPVRAAINGRVLILDGVEKAERNVLPTLNNLLENREMPLDDGRHLIPAAKFDALARELGGVEACTARGLVRVSEHFRVIALGLPVPPYSGHSLDPPLRSRFQARVVEPPFANGFQVPSGGTVAQLLDLTRSGMCDIPFDALLRLDQISRLRTVASLPLTLQDVFTAWPWKFLDHATREEATVTLRHVLGSSLSSTAATATKMLEDASIESVHRNSTHGEFVVTPQLQKLFLQLKEAWDLGHNICLVGPPGCGKSRAIAFFLEEYAQLSAVDDVEAMFMYADMSARDLVEYRVTDEKGNTTWKPSPSLRAAQEGKVLLLDGIDRISSDVLCALAPLIQDRRIPIKSADGVVKASLDFRIIATGVSPAQGNWWIDSEITALFSIHEITDEASSAILAGVTGRADVAKCTSEIAAALRASSAGSDSNMPQLSLRRMLRVARNVSASLDIAPVDASISAATINSAVSESVHQQMLFDLLPAADRELLPRGLSDIQKIRLQSMQNTNGAAPKLTVSNTHVTIGNTQVPKFPAGSSPELVPHVEFHPVASQLQFMESLARTFFVAGEKQVLVVGSQGVGKNRIIDALLEALNIERYYMQLHRDSTVGSLAVSPELDDGKVVWRDSPLVRAAIEGRWLVLDEADKAPLEVVVLLRALFADGLLPLADGRKLGSKSLPIHPNFRAIVLGNRPGFPFLGNDFFRECGDVFYVYLLQNPDADSEFQLAQSVAPEVSAGVLMRLTRAFADLRRLSDEGQLSYPFSTRELLHVVRHIARFGSTEDALQSVLAFDSWSAHTASVVSKTLQLHGFPVDKLFSADSAVLSGDKELDRRNLIRIQSAEPLPPPIRLYLEAGSQQEETLHLSKVLSITRREVDIDLALTSPVEVQFERSSVFTERVASIQLGMPAKGRITGLAAGVGKLCAVVARPYAVTIFELDTDDWSCNERTIGLPPSATWSFGLSDPEILVSGELSTASAPRIGVFPSTGSNSDGNTFVWIGSQKVFVVLPKKSSDHTGILFQIPPESGLSKSLQMVGVAPNGLIVLCDMATGSCAFVDLSAMRIRVAHSNRRSTVTSVCIVNNSVNYQLGTKESASVEIPHSIHSNTVTRVLRSLDKRHSVGAASLVTNVENGTITHIGQSAHIDDSYGFSEVKNKTYSGVERLLWQRTSHSTDSHGVTATCVTSSTVVNCISGAVELIDDIKSGHPTKRLVALSNTSIVACITPLAVTRTSIADRAAVATTDGRIDVIEVSAASLQQSLQEFRDIHNIPKEEGKHKDATGKPKHGKEDNDDHHGGNTYAGGTGGADTAGLGGVGGPYRLDKGFPVHQVSDAVKRQLSPEAAAAARAMAQEALQRRLAQIGMSAASYSAYSALRASVAGEVDELRRVFADAQSKLNERVWRTSADGELDENRLVDALAGDRMVFRRRVKREPKIGDPQLLPKRICILLDCSASMYRFNGSDGRLNRLTEVAVMLMEAFATADAGKYTYEIRAHAGDNSSIRLVDWDSPPTDEKGRYQVVQKMVAHAQHCEAGDTTLQAIANAADSVVLAGAADERIVLAFSDANLDRYGISPQQLSAAIEHRHDSDRVKTHVFFIASFGDQAARLVESAPPGKAAVATDLRMLPRQIKDVLSAIASH